MSLAVVRLIKNGFLEISPVLTILIIGFVGYLTVTHKDMKGEQR